MAKNRLFERIKDQIAEEGLSARTRKSRTWLRQNINALVAGSNSSSRYGMVNLAKNSRSVSEIPGSSRFIGRMYMYFYDPKHKDTLPYYDRFPLIIPVKFYKDGFLGLNLHYVHPKHRLAILDKLESIMTNDKYDDTTRFRISYRYIRAAANLEELQPCLKRYLYGHVRSRLMEVNSDEWDIAVMLPFEDFVKKPKTTVWARSKRQF